jgi:hypothetical protein
LKVKLAGNLLATINNITPTGSSVGDAAFYFTNLVFVPTQASELLEFSTSPTVPNTTPALLLDAVSMVQRDPDDVVIENPSFEASGEPGPTSFPGPMAGWSVSGPHGVNFSPGNVFGDNGLTPDQGEVLYMWHEGTISTEITGLRAGQIYTLIYGVNARLAPPGSVLTYDVTFADTPLLQGRELRPVGGRNPFLTEYLTFTNRAPSGVLAFTTYNEGDTSILLDNVRLLPGIRVPSPPLSISRAAGKVLVTWPVSAQGFVLQETSDLPGGWANSAATVTEQGPSYVAESAPTGSSRFYRLTQ